MTNVTVKDITDKFNGLEKEIGELKSEIFYLRGMLAAVMKRVKKVDDFDVIEVYKSDYDKIKFIRDDHKKLDTILYLDDEMKS